MTTEPGNEAERPAKADAAASLSDDELALLHSAFDHARNGDTAPLVQLLQLGLPANLTNEKGDTLLILAAYYGHTETVRALLEAAADPDRSNDRGQTALSAATFRKDEDTVRALLDGGADPRAGAVSALMVADQFGLPELVDLFRAR